MIWSTMKKQIRDHLSVYTPDYLCFLCDCSIDIPFIFTRRHSLLAPPILHSMTDDNDSLITTLTYD